MDQVEKFIRARPVGHFRQVFQQSDRGVVPEVDRIIEQGNKSNGVGLRLIVMEVIPRGTDSIDNGAGTRTVTGAEDVDEGATV